MRFRCGVLCCVVLGAVGGVYLGCARNESTFDSPKSQLKLTDLKLPKRIIDAHTHFDGDDFETYPTPDMLKEFAECNIVGAVTHLSLDTLEGLKLNAEWAPKRLALCAGIVPGQTVANVEKGLKDKTFRCMKIYLGYVPKYPNDSFYTPFYELADAYKVPVVFHTGDTYDKTALVKFADPLGVDEIAVKYPKMNFVLAHMGNPWYHSAAEVIYKNDNVYADASAFIIGNAETYPPEQIDLLLIKPVNFVFNYALNPKKIMFGSDWPLVDIKPYLQAVQRAIPEKDWEDVFYNNAARVFQFDPP